MDLAPVGPVSALADQGDVSPSAHSGNAEEATPPTCERRVVVVCADTSSSSARFCVDGEDQGCRDNADGSAEGGSPSGSQSGSPSGSQSESRSGRQSASQSGRQAQGKDAGLWHAPALLQARLADLVSREQLREALHAFYTRHSPERLGQVSEIVTKYADDQTTLFIQLAELYADVPNLRGGCSVLVRDVPRDAGCKELGDYLQQFGRVSLVQFFEAEARPGPDAHKFAHVRFAGSVGAVRCLECGGGAHQLRPGTWVHTVAACASQGSCSGATSAPSAAPDAVTGTDTWAAPAAPTFQGGARTARSRPDSQAKLFVHNLAPDADAHHLKVYFTQFGPVVSASVATQRGFGFVTMAETEGARQAACEKLHVFFGRRIRVRADERADQRSDQRADRRAEERAEERADRRADRRACGTTSVAQDTSPRACNQTSKTILWRSGQHSAQLRSEQQTEMNRPLTRGWNEVLPRELPCELPHNPLHDPPHKTTRGLPLRPPHAWNDAPTHEPPRKSPHDLAHAWNDIPPHAPHAAPHCALSFGHTGSHDTSRHDSNRGSSHNSSHGVSHGVCRGNDVSWNGTRDDIEVGARVLVKPRDRAVGDAVDGRASGSGSGSGSGSDSWSGGGSGSWSGGGSGSWSGGGSDRLRDGGSRSWSGGGSSSGSWSGSQRCNGGGRRWNGAPQSGHFPTPQSREQASRNREQASRNREQAAQGSQGRSLYEGRCHSTGRHEDWSHEENMHQRRNIRRRSRSRSWGRDVSQAADRSVP